MDSIARAGSDQSQESDLPVSRDGCLEAISRCLQDDEQGATLGLE